VYWHALVEGILVAAYPGRQFLAVVGFLPQVAVRQYDQVHHRWAKLLRHDPEKDSLLPSKVLQRLKKRGRYSAVREQVPVRPAFLDRPEEQAFLLACLSPLSRLTRASRPG
jgi:hypothetical protein